MGKKHLILILISIGTFQIFGQKPKQEQTNYPNEALPTVLQEFATNKRGAQLPDFSYAGYRNGSPLPEKVKIGQQTVFNVTDYGAIPNDGKDDIDAIQKAVDACCASGGGIVKFPPGQFDFDVITQHRFVRVYCSNITIQGYGDNIDGTVLFDHTPSTFEDSTKPWLAGQNPSFFLVAPNNNSNEDSLLDPVATLGPEVQNSPYLILGKNHNVKPNQTYILKLSNPADGSLLRYLTQPLNHLAKTYQEYQSQGNFTYKTLVKVIALSGNKAFLESPILVDLKSEWRPVLLPVSEILEEVSVEALTLKTAWNQPFHHHKSPEHDNGWDAIKFKWVENSTVRFVVFENVSSAVGLSNCKNNSIYHCQIRGNRGHNGFVFGGISSRNLLYRCLIGNQMHAISFNNQASGNVALECFGGEISGVDFHGGTGVFNLIDHLIGAQLRNGGNKTNTPPAVGIGTTFFNWALSSQHAYNGRLDFSSFDLNTMPKFFAFGVRNKDGYTLTYQTKQGDNQTKDYNGPEAFIYKFNGQMEPKSLYNWQRFMRLGFKDLNQQKKTAE